MANKQTNKKTYFIIDTGAAFSLLTSYSGPTQDSELTIKGVSGVPLRPKISPPLVCQFRKLTLIHSFLIMPQCLMALLERDFARVQPQLIQGIRKGDGVGEDQDTIASIRY